MEKKKINGTNECCSELSNRCYGYTYGYTYIGMFNWNKLEYS